VVCRLGVLGDGLGGACGPTRSSSVVTVVAATVPTVGGGEWGRDWAWRDRPRKPGGNCTNLFPLLCATLAGALSLTRGTGVARPEGSPRSCSSVSGADAGEGRSPFTAIAATWDQVRRAVGASPTSPTRTAGDEVSGMRIHSHHVRGHTNKIKGGGEQPHSTPPLCYRQSSPHVQNSY
jgi:hypothetical protein